jgi:hypothetical protein
MKSAVRKIEPSVVRQEIAVVVRVSGDSIEVEAPAASYEARRAQSCLLAPEVGDEVLVAVVAGRPSYVLAVLERDPSMQARLELDGDVAIRVPRGRLSITSAEGLDVISGKEANVVSSELNVRATKAHVVLEHLALLGGAVLAEVQSARWVAATVDTVAERLVQRVKRAYRFVEEADHLRAERIDYAANKDLTLRGENTVIMADELVKVDGAQIHVG